MKDSEEITKTFSERLRRYRKAHNLSQEQLAQDIMYTGKAVSKWERGEVLPPAIALISIADYFNISLDELLGYYDEASYYLGIDGGGSKTTFSIADAHGTILKTIKLGSSNPIDLGLEKVKAVLDEGIKQITYGIPRRKISVFAGIAGGGIPEMKARIASFLESYGFAKWANDSDAANVIAAGLNKHDGMIVIMGTGSSAFVQKDGRIERIGGLGYLFDHGGCAYDIGNSAIKASCSMEDGTGEKTSIRKYMLEKLGTKTVLENLSMFYQIGKSGIASYCSVVFEAYKRNNDALAERILRHNMAKVANLIVAGRRKLVNKQSKERTKVVLVGGLINEMDILKSLLDEEIVKLDKIEHYEIVIYQEDIVYGALLCAGMPPKTLKTES